MPNSAGKPRLVGRLLDQSHPSRSHAVTASSNVLVNNRGALRQWDRGSDGWHAVEGAPCVLINNRRVHRIRDSHSSSELCSSCSTVLCGDHDNQTPANPTAFCIVFQILLRKKRFEGRVSIEVPASEYEEVLKNKKYRVMEVPEKKGEKPKELVAGRTGEQGKTLAILENAPKRVQLQIWLEEYDAWHEIDVTDLFPTARNQSSSEEDSLVHYTRCVTVYDYLVPVFLVLVTFPARHAHIGQLSVLRGTALASELWGDDFQRYFDKKRTDHDNIQACHSNIRPPSRAEADDTARRVRRAPIRAVANDGEPLLENVPCLNYDINRTYEIQSGTILRIPTTTPVGSPPTFQPFAFRTGGSADSYGNVPRLNFNDQEASLARVHCGREYKRNQVVGLTHSHLAQDEDGTWTNLHITRGCIRVSELWMRSLIAALDPIANFALTQNGYVTRTVLPEPAAVAFLLGEQHADASWCAAVDQTVTYSIPNRRREPSVHTESTCISADDAPAAERERAQWNMEVFQRIIRQP